MRTVFPLGLAFLLISCTTATASYQVSVDIDDRSREDLLLAAGMRVIERRLGTLGEAILDLDLDRTAGTPVIRIETESQAALDLLREELTEPFDLQIMEEAPEAEADIVVEGHGGFSATGVTGEDLVWLEPSEEPNGKGRVTITFSKDGRTKMGRVFSENRGKNIGIFVRRLLVSKLLVDTDELKDDIVITDIPTVELANVFADDVNVGLHVTFTPLP